MKYFLKTSTEPQLFISYNIQYQWQKIDEDELKEVKKVLKLKKMENFENHYLFTITV